MVEPAHEGPPDAGQSPGAAAEQPVAGAAGQRVVADAGWEFQKPAPAEPLSSESHFAREAWAEPGLNSRRLNPHYHCRCCHCCDLPMDPLLARDYSNALSASETQARRFSSPGFREFGRAALAHDGLQDLAGGEEQEPAAVF
ncbi:MAG TPA: hypothetical protein VJ721_07720 [Chthoniobacterales bacterium]|nr:hypothetical protein [Chthoniobacterales bacterium]